MSFIVLSACAPSAQQVRAARAQEYVLPEDAALAVARDVVDDDYRIAYEDERTLHTTERPFRDGMAWTRDPEPGQRGYEQPTEYFSVRVFIVPVADGRYRVEARGRVRRVGRPQRILETGDRDMPGWADDLVGEVQVELRDALAATSR